MLCSLGWLQTHGPSASASQVLGFQVYTIHDISIKCFSWYIRKKRQHITHFNSGEAINLGIEHLQETGRPHVPARKEGTCSLAREKPEYVPVFGISYLLSRNREERKDIPQNADWNVLQPHYLDLKKIVIYLCVSFSVCMRICMLIPMEARRECQIPWIWSDRHLMWVLGNELGSSARALNLWSISQHLEFLPDNLQEFFKKK